jgi:hypothetical protein
MRAAYGVGSGVFESPAKRIMIRLPFSMQPNHEECALTTQIIDHYAERNEQNAQM